VHGQVAAQALTDESDTEEISVEQVMLMDAEMEKYLSPSAAVPDGEGKLQQHRQGMKSVMEQANVEVIEDYQLQFEQAGAKEALIVSRISDEVLMKRETELAEIRIKEAQAHFEHHKRREADLIWREHTAKERVLEVESTTRARLHVERTKMYKETQLRHKVETQGSCASSTEAFPRVCQW
jgi:hypothetical protein